MTPREEADSLREVIAGLPERHRDGPLGDALRARLARLDAGGSAEEEKSQ